LDEAFKRVSVPWAADLRRQRHLGDFTRWKQHDEYQKAFTDCSVISSQPLKKRTSKLVDVKLALEQVLTSRQKE
jgi:hypothetical protein